jgi:hypothetical protein
MKPLDNDEGAASVAATAVDEGSGARMAPSSGFAPTDDAVETPRGQSDVGAAFQSPLSGASASARVSGVVPLGTTTEESVNDAAEAPDSSSMRPSDVVPRSPSPHENRAAVRVAELAMTRPGPSFGLDEDDEATTVDATAGLAFEEREALVQRIHSAMEETLPVGTPPPAPVQPADEAEAARDRRIAFKQTMLLGVAKRETPPPAPVASDEPALLASLVRVVGPPTHPPPRRSRRISAVPSAPPSEPEATEHPDHEAFALMHAIVTPDASKKVVPDAAPPPTAPSLSISVNRSSLPGVMLPPAPEPRDYEPDASLGPASTGAASIGRVPASSPLRAIEPLRATIEPPSSLARTRPPVTRRAAEPPPLEELPVSDPFAGFVAPPPSLLQRWLVVIVVALAVVGLCSLAAIAFGFLGKTGW